MGIRIHHPSLTSCTLLVPHPGDSRTGRNPKDYHIRLDDDGNCIVSDTVWMRLLEARASGLSPHEFLVLNEVKEPPTIMMRKNGRRRTQRTFAQNPDGSIVDAKTRSVIQEFAPKGIKPRIVTHRVQGAS